MQNIFQNYSAPKDSRKNNTSIIEKSQLGRIEILKLFVSEEARAAGISYQPIADLFNVTTGLANDSSNKGVELTKKEKFRLAYLSIGNSAAFAFQLQNMSPEEHTAKIASIESLAKKGLTIDPIKESATSLKDAHPKIAHMLECVVELINNLPQ